MGYKLVVHSEIIFSRGVRACPMPRVRHHKSSGRHWLGQEHSGAKEVGVVWWGGGQNMVGEAERGQRAEWLTLVGAWDRCSVTNPLTWASSSMSLMLKINRGIMRNQIGWRCTVDYLLIFWCDGIEFLLLHLDISFCFREGIWLLFTFHLQRNNISSLLGNHISAVAANPTKLSPPSPLCFQLKTFRMIKN